MQPKESSSRFLVQADSLDVPPGFKRTEVGVIPKDWYLCTVSQMGDVLTGKALAVNGPGQQRPYLRTKNVFDGCVDIEDVLTMPMTDSQFEHFRIRNGDVLLNEGQSVELIGRCAIYRDDYPEPCAMQNQLLRFRAREGVSSNFAAHLFRYCQQTGVFARIALQTTSIAHLGSSRFEGLKLAWPATEAEQCVIAEALSDVDRLIDALEALIGKKRAIKQSALQQLLTRQIKLPGFNGKWETKRIQDLVEVPVTDGPHLTPTFLPDGIPFLSVNNLANNRIDTNELRYISVEDHREFSKKCKPRKWDVLLGKAASVGKVALVDYDWEFNIWSPIALIRVDKSCVPWFIYYTLQTRAIAKQIGFFTNSSSQGNLGMGAIEKLELLLPLKDEQLGIATLLRDMDAEIAALEARREKTLAIKQGMMQQLLTGRIRLIQPEQAEVTA